MSAEEAKAFGIVDEVIDKRTVEPEEPEADLRASPVESLAELSPRRIEQAVFGNRGPAAA